LALTAMAAFRPNALAPGLYCRKPVTVRFDVVEPAKRPVMARCRTVEERSVENASDPLDRNTALELFDPGSMGLERTADQ